MATMIQGTTPTHVFTLPIDTSTISQLRITYIQGGTVVLDAKENDDNVTMEDNIIKYRLNQEDTLKFNSSEMVLLQLKVLTSEGDVMASKIMRLSVEKILNTEVLG